jgi:hypothetical protein
MKIKKYFAIVLVSVLTTLNVSPVYAADITGTVAMLEVWRNGNVAFTLSAPISECNQQFILNVSSPGTKNMYAALLAAKKTGAPVRVYTGGCGLAEQYGGSYNIVEYLYVVE